MHLKKLLFAILARPFYLALFVLFLVVEPRVFIYLLYVQVAMVCLFLAILALYGTASVFLGLCEVFVSQWNSRNIKFPPFSLNKKVFFFIFPKKIAERVFLQIIEEAEEEYYEALSNQQKLLSRWIRIRTYFILLNAFVAQLGGSLIKLAVNALKVSS